MSPSPRCRGNSITPTVATGHQSVKRDEKAVTTNLTSNPAEQESMDSESEDVVELSSHVNSQLRLTGCRQKAKDRGWLLQDRPVCTPIKPGREHHPNDSSTVNRNEVNVCSS